VGTDKRARQKSGRQSRLEQAQAEAKKAQTRGAVFKWGGIGLAIAVFIIGYAWLNRDSGSKTSTTSGSSTTVAGATTTTAKPGVFTYGTTECPPAAGAAKQTQSFSAPFKQCIDPAKTYTATIVTTKGELKVALDPKKAPGTVNNFVALARNKYFDGTPCHRIIPSFVAQCGDPTGKGTGGPGYKFADELPQAGEYKIGSLAMANSGPNTNGSQFFIITGDQGVALPPNYSLFGQALPGQDAVIKALDAAGSDQNNGVPPKEPVSLTSVTITES
jgi:cyclophilin family peptidyl-prolyl cis-trans isomerase